MARRRILVLLSSAGGGDRPPVVALATDLQRHGHEVLISCDAAMTRMAAQTGVPFTTHAVPQVGYISQWIKELDGDPANPLVVWGEDAMPDTLAAARDFAPDLIVSALFTMGLASLLASTLGVPWVFVNPSFYFGEGAETRWNEDWHGPFVPRLARECFDPLVRQADLVMHATDSGFDFPPPELPDRHYYVGFLFWEGDTPRPAFLDRPGDPWVLVTASSARPSDEATMLSAAMLALEDESVRALVTQPSRSYQLPATVNSVIEGFVPHTPVLQQSIMSVSHGGHGIVSKCVALGVPMVLLPWDADQPGVAARAAARGVAEVVPRDQVSGDSVRRAVEATLSDPRRRDVAAELAAGVASRHRPQLAAELVEAV